jgi:hypothetical protein
MIRNAAQGHTLRRRTRLYAVRVYIRYKLADLVIATDGFRDRAEGGREKGGRKESNGEAAIKIRPYISK